MRILQVSSAKAFGGGERHFVDLARALTERGHDVFAAVRPTSEWQKRLDLLPAEHLLQVSIRNSFGIFSATRIAAFARENNIDIIHAHVARDYIPASLAAIMTPQAGFVLTRHLVFPLKPFNRIVLKNLDRAIAVSAGVERGLRKTFDHKKITVIPNGIDVQKWAVAERGVLRKDFRLRHAIPMDVPLVGIVGELIANKGQNDLIRAAEKLNAERPNTHFIVVGKDHSIGKKYRDALRKQVFESGLAEKFVWVDWVENTAELYAAIDVFVSASHSESFGLAMLEAMAAGTPVVATETAGARELLGNDAILIKAGDAAELAAAIGSKLSDAVAAADEAAFRQREAAERFSIDRMAEATENVYREVAEGRKK